MSGEAPPALPTEVIFMYIEPKPIVKAHLIVNCVVVGLAMVILGCRVWARFGTGVKFGWDDWLAFASMPQGIGMLVIQGLYSRLGVGYDITVTMPNMPAILRLLVAYELIYTTCIATVKLSMMFFYLRVFVNDGLRRATKAAMIFVMTWSVANVLQVFVICRPFASSYDLTVPGKCGNRISSFIAIGAFNIITDVLILTLPLTTIWALKMKTSAKLGITIVFLMGLLVSGVAIVRIVSLTKLDLNNLTLTMIEADFWSTFEPNLGIICVTLPMMGPIWASCTRRIRGGTTQQSTPAGGSYSQGSKKFNRLHNRHESYGMDTMYTQNKQTGYTITTAKASGNVKDEERSLSGSETALALEYQQRKATAVLET